jgi:hypothetical protein
MRVKFFILFFLLFSITASLFSQDEESGLVQFSGVVRSLKYEPIPDVHVINIHKKTGTTSNEKGLFSFITSPSDSILFTAVGFKHTLVVIPNSIEGGHYPRDVYMLNDTIHLAEVKIFPWKTYQEFKVAFLNLDLSDTDEQRAKDNIALIKVQLNMDFEPDANLSYKYAMQSHYDKLYYAGQYPSYSILNPLKWAEFFKALKSGDLKKDEDK